MHHVSCSTKDTHTAVFGLWCSEKARVTASFPVLLLGGVPFGGWVTLWVRPQLQIRCIQPLALHCCWNGKSPSGTHTHIHTVTYAAINDTLESGNHYIMMEGLILSNIKLLHRLSSHTTCTHSITLPPHSLSSPYSPQNKCQTTNKYPRKTTELTLFSWILSWNKCQIQQKVFDKC